MFDKLCLPNAPSCLSGGALTVFSFDIWQKSFLSTSILRLHALADYLFVPGMISECAECCVTFVALNV